MKNMTKRTTMYQTIGNAIARFAVNHRVITIAIGLAVFALFCARANRLAFSTDYRIFFSSDDAGLGAFEKLEATFSKTDNILFVVKSPASSVFEGDTLDAVREITEEGSAVPFASRVDSVSNFQHAEAEGDDIRVRELVPAGDLSEADRSHAKQLAMAEPILVGSLLSRDATTTAVNLTLNLPRKDPSEVSASVGSAREIAAKARAAHPDLDIRVTGMATMNHAFMETSVRDLSVMIPLMLIVMLLAMAVLLRSIPATIAVGSVIAIAAGASMTVAGWFGYPLTPPSVAAPMMVLTVAIADGVHIVLSASAALAAGHAKREAIIIAIRDNLEAVTYTWLTTVVGFLCLNFSQSPPVNHLANMTSVGVTLAFIYSIAFMPAVLASLPLKARAERGEATSHRLAMLSTWVIKHRNMVLGVTVALTLIFGAAASQLRTNDQFIQYFSKSTAFRQDAEFAMKNLSGIYRLEFQVPSAGEDGVTAPEYLQKLDSFATWLRAQHEVDHVFTFADIMKRVHSATNGDAPGAYSLPESRGAAAEDLLVYEMALPQGLDLKDRVSTDRASTRVSVIVKDMSSRDMTAFATRAESWLKDNTGIETQASGPVVIFSALSDRNAQGMMKGDLVSVFLISICMIVVLRSVRLGILSVVPNVVPIIIGYGVWYFAVGQMNVVASVAGSISLGIIVDDTIHFLTHFQASLRETDDVEKAMADTLAHSGPAMLSTSIVLALGFGVLTFSAFQMTSYLGWLSVLVVAIAPLADLFMVPALVLTLYSRRASRVSSPDLSPSTNTAGAST